MNATFLFRGFVAALILACGGGLAAAELEWQSYTSPAGRFKVEFPGEATVSQGVTIQTGCFRKDLVADFRVSYNDRPARDPSAEDSFRELDRIRALGCEQIGVAAEHVQKFTWSGRPACVFDFVHAKGGMRFYTRQWFIIDGARFYQLQYLYLANSPQQEAGEHFYHSFQITR
jgi:hypothetical protein